MTIPLYIYLKVPLVYFLDILGVGWLYIYLIIILFVLLSGMFVNKDSTYNAAVKLIQLLALETSINLLVELSNSWYIWTDDAIDIFD